MSDFTDQEWRYYLSAQLVTVWDHRSKYFGTFDARTESVKEDMLLDWSNGKINQIKNSLLQKGVFKKAKDYRLAIVNADIFLGRGRRSESMIRDAETNLQRDENYLQRTENTAGYIRAATRSIAKGMSVSNHDQIQPNEYRASWKEIKEI